MVSDRTTKLYRRLRKLARVGAKGKGHDMMPFSAFTPEGDRIIAECRCRRCGEGLRVETHPAPNSIGISGSVFGKVCR